MDAGSAGGSEEVGVVGPAGDDVDVKMFRDAGAGGGTEVDADVEAFWLHDSAESIGHPVDEGPEVGRFLGGKRSQIVHLTVGADEDVAEVIGVSVKNGERGFRSGEDEVGGVIGGVG